MNLVRIERLLMLLAVAAATFISGCGSSSGVAPAGSVAPAAAQVGHVFVLILENKSYTTTFTPDSLAPYLAQTLAAKGALLMNYYGTDHNSQPNYISMISGLGPNPTMQLDCQTFSDLVGTTATGDAVGAGCVLPTSTASLPDQLTAAGLGWKAYMEDMGNDPTRESATCGHPAVGPLSQDQTQSATPTDQYATRHDPFVYFHSIIDDQASCDSHVVNLQALPGDLGNESSTPSYVFITPNLCNDGHDSNCANGDVGGLTSVNDFLKLWVPRIMNSAAYKKDGMLIITFDESDGPTADSSACCGEIGLNGITGPGGGRIGAVVLSPFVEPGTISLTPYNHYGMLKTVEDLFGLDYLAHAGDSGVSSFGADVFTRKMPSLPAKPAS